MSNRKPNKQQKSGLSKKEEAKKQKELEEFNKELEDTVAFVLCHPFACTMSPINGELPPCLFPLCNAPVLLYVLNWLNSNGLEKIYILCRTNDKEQIQKVTSLCSSRMLIQGIEIVDTMEPANNVGDCMRIIDKWNQQYNAFKHCVVVPGTLVTNVPLKTVIHRHINDIIVAKEKKDEMQLVATCVFTQGNYNTYNVMESEQHSILQIGSTAEFEFNFGRSPLQINLTKGFFKKVSRYHILTNLHDAHVYVCTAQMFPDFGEQFDWKNFCDDCIPTQIDVMELTKHVTHIFYCKESFAKTIDDLPDYIDTSLAMLHRWLYPLTVEMNFFPPYETKSAMDDDFPMDEEEEMEDKFIKKISSDLQDNEDLARFLQEPENIESTAYRIKRDLVYLYENVFPSLSAKVGPLVVIGNNTKVGDNTIIKNSVIGANCTIGKNVKIENSIIWDDVVIGDNVKIDQSLIASKCVLSDGITIDYGCIISFGCTVKRDIPECRRLTTFQELLPDGLFPTEETDVTLPPDVPSWLGKFCEQKFEDPIDLGEDENYTVTEFFPTPMHEIPLLRMAQARDKLPIEPEDILQASYPEEEEDQFENEEEDVENDGEDNENENEKCDVPINEEFLKLAQELINQAITKDGGLDNVKTELGSLKMKEGAIELDCAVALIIAAIDMSNANEEDDLQSALDKFEDLLFKYLETSENQADVLYWWQWYCAVDYSNRKELFVEVVKKLVEDDVVQEDAYADWRDGQDDSTPTQRKLYDSYIESSE
ncbi:hypothetical protein TVAG_498830 [Trichomonas vaginalis G3]|uniref:Translation initiation factor eIF2B subunit epsilon n=1 Tax=Trichomonas vaginalis (strain ATCC PRA-98 / G3) TaxID=412133 RepID=A2E871_TRIV3|nr:translation initiation factor eIF-2b subunit epsilon family [Trichomonas vaginalis G3]EAY11189.1 hypothetical protein TVAG_498830 [Trichomonas vaginalis G3]KAI5487300.1 translation initiation factor eIF-2b subunit epsilon family [Trichomonas vaginalis G3]|eukprot:XP_001323412.1 hypothetical protein [Trichomonas vaginalis G3]